ncbi:ATPase involved in chromosome partitioning [Serpentinimonas raichei]|uniref:ATPase involved in chromosome partitioning n=1 Tax=Serpentinimonas raichei TaxID=1458425 RepID=A0A060NJQ7_9BURK|nr:MULTISPECIES: ParA family protein [Serpentinimonas]BAO81430.1 ATPase involved in chromosome partitioning [Serpentinimonas raichei]
MTVIVVANPKGGVGKSTLSTQVAGYLARRGHTVLLGDSDRQQSASRWLALRPKQARPIVTWDASHGDSLKPPPGTTHVVLDTPAGLHGRDLKEVLKRADKLLIPLQPSVFDIMATQDFVAELQERRRSVGLPIGVVGMRVDARTHSAEKLRSFVEGLELPVLAYLRDTQNYIHLAGQGLTLFDVAPGRVQRDLEQWLPICRWLEH